MLLNRTKDEDIGLYLSDLKLQDTLSYLDQDMKRFNRWITLLITFAFGLLFFSFIFASNFDSTLLASRFHVYALRTKISALNAFDWTMTNIGYHSDVDRLT